MNIAICGASCTGKSTLAKLVAERLACEMRGCGALVRDAANRLCVEPELLSPKVHRQIDVDTVQLTNTPSDHHRIIDGRYLRYVLSRCTQPVLTIELMASAEMRLARWQERLGMPLTIEWLQSLDLADKNFVEKMYRGVAPLHPAVTIDTSQQPADTCADLLVFVFRGT